MLHELLLALQGCPGSIFVENREGEIQVTRELPFIHPCEISILNELCKLGSSYKFFQDFIYHLSFATDKREDLHGLYLQAFCNGFDKVLNPYRQDILDLEKEILEDPYIHLDHLLHKLSKYSLLFSALMELIQQMKKNRVHGCNILNLVFKYSSSGILLVSQSMNEILRSCHGVFYRQLTAWMLHGILMDPYKEFFIVKIHSKTSSQDLETRQAKETSSHEIQKYKLNSDFLPTYVSTRTADKILFVGQSVSVFGKSKQGTLVNSTDSIFSNKEDKFAEELFNLNKLEEFSVTDFEATIDEIRSCTAEHLWKVVVEEANLLGHFKVIKDYYLLGRGELFIDFIDHTNEFLKRPVGATAEHDINLAFQLSARRILLEDDSFVEKFYFTLPTKDKSAKKEVPPTTIVNSGWSVIGLTYEVPFPLQIILTPSVLDRYGTIFRFLLTVRRVQIELHQCWALQMLTKTAGRESENAPVWQLRTHMSFLVDNLQYYLQVDVLESQFSMLVEKVKSMKDFEAIQHAHEHFLTSLSSQSFFFYKPAYECIQQILEMCLDFCNLVNHSEKTLGQREMNTLGALANKFCDQTSMLFTILTKVRSHQSSPYLAQLLLRIDFNKYLSNCDGFLGGILAANHEEKKVETQRKLPGLSTAV